MATPESRARREILAKVPMFSSLSESALSELAEVAHARCLKPREELCHKGDEGSQVYIIVRGRLRVSATSAEGSDVQFNLMNPGEVCGDLALFTGGERSATMSAFDECEVLGLDRREFLPFLRRNPDAAIQLLEVLAERLVRLTERMEDTLFLALPQRLAKRLLALADEYGERDDATVRIEMRLSQSELGTMVGTSRESVNKQMRAWQSGGLVKTERGVITLLLPDALEDVASSDE
jgi:CRP/FNR family cyclic AMP-dependent transcriptional regulator